MPRRYIDQIIYNTCVYTRVYTYTYKYITILPRRKETFINDHYIIQPAYLIIHMESYKLH